jgi:hypothetical protein
MASHYEAPIRRPLSYRREIISRCISGCGKTRRRVKPINLVDCFSISLVAFLWGIGCIIYTISTGIGTWGLNKTVNWAWDITNFVWWVGIGHAGTLISAVLLIIPSKMENGD